LNANRLQAQNPPPESLRQIFRAGIAIIGAKEFPALSENIFFQRPRIKVAADASLDQS
jgi:hypothetical protein